MAAQGIRAGGLERDSFLFVLGVGKDVVESQLTLLIEAANGSERP